MLCTSGPRYARDEDQKIWLKFSKFAYKKTKDGNKLKDGFYKKDNSQAQKWEFTDKRSAFYLES
jgi:hypothetical protein